jgi:hypothetical protein
MARIAFITSIYDRLFQRRYRRPLYDIQLLLAALEERGHEVVYVARPDPFVPADSAIMHVDCSVVPQAYLELAARYPVCLNGRCADITKRAVSGTRVDLHPEWDGPVIVKSNLNHFGHAERSQNLRALTQLAPPPFPHAPLFRPRYRVYPRLAEVPKRLRTDPNLVIEVFAPERTEEGYGVYSWQFMGDTGFAYFCAGPEPVLRFSKAERIEVCPLPDLEDERRRLGLDFGKLDYVVLNGKPTIIDANKTVGNAPRPGWQAPDRTGADRRTDALARALGIA